MNDDSEFTRLMMTISPSDRRPYLLIDDCAIAAKKWLQSYLGIDTFTATDVIFLARLFADERARDGAHTQKAAGPVERNIATDTLSDRKEKADKTRKSSGIRPAVISQSGKRHIQAQAVLDLCGGISEMTLWRWLRDPDMAFPKPTYIHRRRYWLEADVVAWRKRQSEEQPPEKS